MRVAPRSVLVLAVLCVIANTAAADAQSGPARQSPRSRPGGPARLELGGGVGVDTAVALGDREAALRGTTGGGSPLFRTSTELRAAARVEARLGFALTPRYTVEGQFGFARPGIRTAISGDVEGGSDVSAAGEIYQYSVSIGVAARLPVTVAGLTPFLAGGAGYVREFRENLPPMETGYVVYGGGGVRRDLLMRPNRFLRTVGVRGDLRWQRVDGVVPVLERPRSQAAISGGVFVAF